MKIPSWEILNHLSGNILALFAIIWYGTIAFPLPGRAVGVHRARSGVCYTHCCYESYEIKKT